MRGPINVLYYDVSSGFGGSARCLLAWLKNHDPAKICPVVVVRGIGPAVQAIMKLDVKTYVLPFFPVCPSTRNRLVNYILLLIHGIFCGFPATIWTYNIARRHKARIFHLNTKIHGVIPAILAAKMLRLQVVCHLHDVTPPLPREKFFSRWISCFIALTKKALDFYRCEFPGKRIELIPNGIDLVDYHLTGDGSKAYFEFGVLSDEKVIGIVGRLVEGKGFDDCIKATHILLQKGIKTKLLIVGSVAGEDHLYETYLRGLVEQLGIQDKVIFTGWREDVKSIMSTFDVLVQASSTFPEGFGMTCIEAMALSKPVVVTDVPGPSELIENEVTGIIVPPSNPVALSEAIMRIILDPALARAMGEAGRRRVERLFGIQQNVAGMSELYEELTGSMQ